MVVSCKTAKKIMIYTSVKYMSFCSVGRNGKQKNLILSPSNILNAIKNATGTSVIFPINISLLLFVSVLTSVPNVGERFTKTCAQLHTPAKKFGEK